jgi:hypothetical protein
MLFLKTLFQFSILCLLWRFLRREGGGEGARREVIRTECGRRGGEPRSEVFENWMIWITNEN